MANGPGSARTDGDSPAEEDAGTISICTCILHFTSSIGVLETKKQGGNWAGRLSGSMEGAYRKKLVMAPAPAAATAICGSGSSWVAGVPPIQRIAFCNSLYARKREAFSTMAPTTGAGRPYANVANDS